MLPSPTSLILVAVMNSPRDMEIARLLGWYRIPLRSAPKIVSVDYLAFYQTAAFGEAKWRIQTVAPVQGYELTTRLELLRDEPHHPHARQEYFKIQTGPLVNLPQPILAESWRRITFFYTTGEYLLRARTVNDLIVHTEERALLWQALRERANQAAEYTTHTPSLPAEIDPALLEILLGIKETQTSYSLSETENG